jgi:carboxypeptidase Taq
VTNNATYDTLLERLGTIKDLSSTLGMLGWDQRTIMPRNGAAARAHRMATLSRILNETATDPAIEGWFAELEAYEAGLDPDSDEASIIRVARRDYEKARIVPTGLKVRLTEATNAGYMAWVSARAKSDFSILLPHLETIVGLHKEAIAITRAANDSFAEDYDVLLDDYEPRLSSVEVDRVFSALRNATIPLVQKVTERSDRVDDSILHQDFDVATQETLVTAVAKQLGFTDEAWRLDVTQHPFANSVAIDDIRITTRYYPDYFNPAFFGTMHEFGHGLYEHDVSHTLERTPLARGASMAFHESQSRMWENLIGRGRPFWAWALPVVQEYFPQQFANATANEMFRAVNKLGPSFIRVEADELTYNLHIIIRFEIERDLFSGRIEVKDLPETWNARMKEYLGVDVPNDAEGVLQDVHWGSGLFGYFPTYALGNVVSLQLWDRIRREISDLDDQTAAGEFASLREWLKENIHQHGRKFTPNDLLERVVGVREFDPHPLIAYLTAKVDDLYGE